MSSDPCPAYEVLERLAASERAWSDGGPLVAHVTSCRGCSEQITLIRADNALLEEVLLAELAMPGDRPLPACAEGLNVPGYTILREIHRGGQGVVYEAVQLATKRRVALKMLLHGAFAGSRQRSRFEREVEIIAGLRHPNIVTLYESGVLPDGQLYLAMELVEGVPLHQYLPAPAARRGAELRRLVRLFADICAAVNAAHQRGIIHRDLKPANILVDRDGQPHVLDFGLARQADSAAAPAAGATIAGEFLGTFAYAAPEQVSGDPQQVDVRTDVYALGVILYEVLVGARPYEVGGSVADAVQAILHRQPPAPSTLNLAVDDELDTIAMKSLMKDPQRRYQSAGALLEDVRHYLADEPINAKRDSHWYLLRKTMTRHRVALGISVLLFLAAIATTTAMTVLKQRADQAKARAEQESIAKSQALMSFLKMLESDPLWTRSGEETLPRMLAEADQIAATELTGQPEIEAAVRTRLGEAHLKRGSYAIALDQFEAALRLREEHRGAALDVAESVHNCARAHWYLGEYNQAEHLYGRALDIRVDVLGPNHEEVATSMSHLAATYRQQGRYDEAQTLYESVLSLRRGLFGKAHPAIAASLNNLGVCLRDRRRYGEAAALFRESLAMIGSLGAGEAEHVAATLHSLGKCLLEEGDRDEAERVIDEAMAIKQRLYEDSHPSIGLTQAVRAKICYRRGNLAAAASDGAAALSIQEGAYGSEHREIADTLELLGRIALAQGAPANAEPHLNRSLRLRLASLPANHWEVADARGLLGESLVALGRSGEAEPLLLQSHQDLLLTQTPHDQLLLAAIERLAKLCEAQGRAEDAARYRAQLAVAPQQR